MIKNHVCIASLAMAMVAVGVPGSIARYLGECSKAGIGNQGGTVRGR
jgi:hypothetical protein